MDITEKNKADEKGNGLKNLFTGFAQDNLRKVLIDFIQMPGIASQKDGGAVVVFGNAYLIGVKELFHNVFIITFNPAGGVILGRFKSCLLYTSPSPRDTR